MCSKRASDRQPPRSLGTHNYKNELKTSSIMFVMILFQGILGEPLWNLLSFRLQHEKSSAFSRTI